jgi:hypothetical protein
MRSNDKEEGVGVGIAEGPADTECEAVDPWDGGSLYKEPMLENRWAKRGIMIEARLSSKAIRVLCDMDWYTEDKGMPSALKNILSHVISKEGGPQTNLGHNDILAPEAIIWVRVVEIYIRDRNGGVGADIFHSCHFRFGFASRHKPTGNACDDNTAIA